MTSNNVGLVARFRCPRQPTQDRERFRYCTNGGVERKLNPVPLFRRGDINRGARLVRFNETVTNNGAEFDGPAFGCVSNECAKEQER